MNNQILTINDRKYIFIRPVSFDKKKLVMVLSVVDIKNKKFYPSAKFNFNKVTDASVRESYNQYEDQALSNIRKESIEDWKADQWANKELRKVVEETMELIGMTDSEKHNMRNSSFLKTLFN